MTNQLARPFRVAVFGSSQGQPTDPDYIFARRLGNALAAKGWDVVCGGYYGLMEAVSHGAREGGGQVIGVTVGSFFPKEPNRFITDRRHERLLYERIARLIELSDAVVVLPGGLGTLTELCTTWLLKQVQLIPSQYPVIVLDTNTWKVVESAAHTLKMSQNDLSLLTSSGSLDDVVTRLDTWSHSKSARVSMTVGIAVYNDERFLKRSLRSALEQSLSATEVIVVDDGSTDGTPQILESLRGEFPCLSVVRQSHRGTPVALNRILQLCQTEYLLGLDSDDQLEPDAIEHMNKATFEWPEAAIIYSDHVVVDSGDNVVDRRNSVDPCEALARLELLHERLSVHNTDNFLPLGHARLYHVDRIRSIGGYSCDLPYAEDYDLVLRAAEAWPLAHVSRSLYRYRWHGQNKSVVRRAEQVEDVREAFRRHRWRVQRSVLHE